MMNFTFNFERLRVWIEAKELTKSLYSILASSDFPEQERYNLVSQMKRCAVSISSNIAEGTVRSTNKDKQRFIIMAYGSAIELVNQLIISNELGYLNDETLIDMRKKITTICSMLSGLKKSFDQAPAAKRSTLNAQRSTLNAKR